MSSNNRPIDEMPPALTAMWRALKRGYIAEPTLLVISFLLALLAALPDALFALWLMCLGKGLLEDDQSLLWIGIVGLGVSATLTWVLKIVSDRTQRRFRDRVAIALETHVAELQASVITVTHHERPDYLDRLAVLRDQVFTLDHMYMSIFSTAGWILRLAVTGILIASIHPVLLCLVLFAIPTVATASVRPAVERAAEERGAPHNRLARHLFETATSASPGKEVRLASIGSKLTLERRASWNHFYHEVSSARTISAVFHCLSWMVFGIGFVLAVVFVVYGLKASAGQTLLLLAAGSRLSSYISATVGELGFLRGIWMDGSKRLAWLEDYAEHVKQTEDTPAPTELHDGIEFEHVSFAYPGTDKNVLDDVNLKLNAGSVIAIVGENGAGKTTLVKLLSRMYTPTEGTIRVDGLDLSRISASEWRERLAGAFQDFFRFELPARSTVGIGDVPRLDQPNAVEDAVTRAGADDVVDQLANGMDTQLGPTWPEGVEVSFGQWQKLSLARGFMREQPLVLILDEPTAALDSETEHALFERYASASRREAANPSEEPANSSQTTVLVSHRFSTVRMADQIIVLDGARVVESGSHEELVRANGQYAELYEIQASAYR